LRFDAHLARDVDNILSQWLGILMAKPQHHQTHPEIVKRLNRAQGHLLSVIEMIESGRQCLDIAQQLHAVEKAVGQAKKTLIQDHLDHCLDNVTESLPREQRRAIDGFREIAKYL
jgi:DNA-binding FrmR family transcriptional regulator